MFSVWVGVEWGFAGGFFVVNVRRAGWRRARVKKEKERKKGPGSIK